MGNFVWKESYSVGVSSMDEQHKKLVQMIDSLNDAMATGKGREIINKVLDEMVDYTIKHFKDEEKLLQKYDFPGFKEQKDEHEAFIRKVNEMRQESKNKSLTISIEASQFLRSWLTEHILGVDKKYGSFLNNSHGEK